MSNDKKIRQLNDLCELVRDRTNEIFDSAKITSEFLAKQGYPSITASRLKHLEELLRDMAQRLVRVADEVATIRG